MVQGKAPLAGMILGGTALAAALTGCGAAGRLATPAGASTVAQQSSAGQSAAGSRCKAGDLQVSLGGGDAGMGHTYRTVRFTNVSGHPCTVQGFPGVSYVAGGDGHQVGAPAARTGSGGTAIGLADGQTASTTVGMVNVHNYSTAKCKPEAIRGFRVYVPEERAAKFVQLNGTGCANAKVRQLTVKALQAGRGQ
ncbi:MAG: hypothetical protein JWO67_625 [Streptosporangiaceae bacterium]|nr:hypothetical protein [Streptosporangiaceae bacterium]